jgi:hypothetical protein
MSEGAPSQPDLTAAREQVMAFVAGSALALGPPTALATAPLRALPAVVEAKLSARVEAGLAATGPDYPRRRVWQRVVVPSGGLAVLDAAGIAAGAGSGHWLVTAGAALLFVPLAVLAGLGARFAARDPLRLSTRDRRAIGGASRWVSRQAWTGRLASTEERGVVIAAARAAERIARSRTWRSGRIDDQRLRIDVGAELDQIDEQAHRIAVARQEHGSAAPGSAPVIATAWDATVTRVAALTAYADSLEGYDQRRAESLVRQGDPVRDSDLLAGSARDEMALTELLALTSYLSTQTDDPLG